MNRNLKTRNIAIGTIIMLAAVAVAGKIIVVRINSEQEFQGKTVRQWRLELQSGDAIRSNAAYGVVCSAIIPHLLDTALHDTNDSPWRLRAIQVLNGLPGVQMHYVTASGRRVDAVRQIGELGPSAAAAVPVLIQILKSREEWRSEAAISLGAIHSDPAHSIPALTAALGDEGTDDSAALALAAFGPQARSAFPKIVPFLHGGKEERRAAHLALPRVDPEAAAKLGIAKPGGPIPAK